MTQCKTFYNPVRKADGSGETVEVGDSVTVILKDNTEVAVTVTAVSRQGRRICWDMTTGQPRSMDVNGVSGDHVKICPAYYSLHDGPEDSGTLDPVISND